MTGSSEDALAEVNEMRIAGCIDLMEYWSISVPGLAGKEVL